jgi:hypothetical protein
MDLENTVNAINVNYTGIIQAQFYCVCTPYFRLIEQVKRLKK